LLFLAERVENPPVDSVTRPPLRLLLATASLTLLATSYVSSFAQEGKQPPRTLPDSWVSKFDWRSVGPANMGGRITSITVDSTDSTHYWIGTATGGVLRTTNNGVSYDHQFQHEAVSSIGDITVAPSNPEIVWVGTGESNPRNSVSWGNGVYKSVDGGDTWKHMGLENSFQIGAVEIHPENPDIVYVGALGRLWGTNEERGLYKTTDGGETWARVLYVDDKTGVIDMRMHPEQPDTLIVATYDRQRDRFDTNDPAQKWGDGSGLWKTTDGGATWKQLSEGLPTGMYGRIGLDWSRSEPNTVFAIVESDLITQVPEDSAYMGLRGTNADVGARLTEITEDGPAAEAGLKVDDILVQLDGVLINSWDDLRGEIRKHKAGQTVGVIVSRDRKTVEMDVSFTRKPTEEEDQEEAENEAPTEAEKVEEEPKDEPPKPGPFHLGLGGQSSNVQDQQGENGFEYGGLYRSDDQGESWTRINSINPRPMYYSRVYVDPSDTQHIYVLGTQLHTSHDGGKTFRADGHDNSVHVDHHNMWINPNDGRHMILGNDGGVWVTWDRMKSWDHHNHMALGQFYQITTDDTRDYRIYGGLQDNGSWGGPNRVGGEAGPVNGDWFMIGWGDGFVCRVDTENPNLVYGESQGGAIYRHDIDSGQTGYIRARAPRGQQYRFNWNTPFLLSSHNSKIFYSAGNYVFRSLDRGNGLKAISPEITLTDRGSATALAESPRDSDVLWVGSDDGALWMTKNNGHDWLDMYADPVTEETHAEGAATETSETEGGDTKTVEVAPDDPITGHWEGRMEHEEIPEDQGSYSMDLKLSDKGKITGSVNTDFGDSTIVEGKFDAETGKVNFRFRSDQMEAILTGKISTAGMSGEIDAGPGWIQLEFTAKRDPVQVKAIDPAVAKAPAAVVPTTSEKPAAASAETKKAPSFEASVNQRFKDRFPDGVPQRMMDRMKERFPDGLPAEFGRGGRLAGGGAEAHPESQDPGAEAAVANRLIELMPGRYLVSSIVPSTFQDGRVYVTFDGHRSNDTLPYIMVTEDLGKTWHSLRGDLPDSAGSVRVLVEDLENQSLLFLGTEFGAWASIDRGHSWTRINHNLPTVPVHDLKVHPLSGELIAGTHGRSAWVVDISALRHMSSSTVKDAVKLYPPNHVIQWKRQAQRADSGTRRFVGSNPDSDAHLYYSMSGRNRNAQMWITNHEGDTIKTFEVASDPGLHRVDWDLRADSQQGGNSRFRRRGRLLPTGNYTVHLKAGGTTWTENLEVLLDPSLPNPRWQR
jgi:photosystem II stability/assembly factor-like uncharacterized protein